VFSLTNHKILETNVASMVLSKQI